MDITSLSLIDTLEALKNKNFSDEELNRAYFEKIERLNPKLNIFLRAIKNTKGIPVAIKDMIITKDIETTAGSKILSGFIPPYNASVVQKLLNQGVSIIGKTNHDEFAMGSSGENSAFGLTKNPWNLNKVPGGSSSGSAAAVAANMSVFSLGTDTGGSIRQPASLCGVVGLKPSYGRVSRYGAIAMGSSLDQIGPFTKTVADMRLVMEWISGSDGFDANCFDKPFKSIDSRFRGNDNASLRAPVKQSLEGIKIGVPKEYFGEGLDKGVEKVIKDAIKKLEELGASIVEISLPNTEYAMPAYYIIVFSEVSANLAKYDGIRFGRTRENFGDEPKRRIMLGTFALSAGYFDDYFIKAAKVRTLVKQDFEKAFEKVDCIVGPVSPTVAWNIGEKIDDPLKMYLSDVYTVPASLAGICGLSIPCGFSEGLPVGLQILGNTLEEDKILAIGDVYEKVTNWYKKKPKL